MIFAFLITSACGTSAVSDTKTIPETAAVPDTTTAPKASTTPKTTVEKEVVTSEELQEEALENCPKADDAFAQDDQFYAEDYGVSEEQAIRRARLQNCFADELAKLERELKAQEHDSFAGLWIEHEPEYRFVVLFTQHGQQTIRPYTKGEPYAPLVEVRSGAEATFAELRAAERKAARIVDKLGLRADSSFDVLKNRAELYVANREEFKAELREAGMRLPEHVVLIEGGLSLPAS